MGARRYGLVMAFLALSGAKCGDDDPSSLETMVRFWSFSRFVNGATGEERVGDERAQVGGSVDETIEFGALILSPVFVPPNSKAEVFSNNTGKTYWVGAVGPNTTLQPPGGTIGNSASLTQYQYFRKTSDNATLRMVISKVFLEAIDENGGLPTALECPWHGSVNVLLACKRTMWSWVSFHVSAFSFFDQNEFVNTGGFAELMGWRGAWEYDAYTDSSARTPFWGPLQFHIERDVDQTGGGHSVVYIPEPITIEIPLATVPTGELFYLLVDAKASTLNHRQRESFLQAFFQDPEESRGLAMEYQGIEPVETPSERPASIPAVAAPACETPDPEAGTLAFASADVLAPELPGEGATVFVTRSGGSHGAVSVRLTTADGTASAGADYSAVDTQVLFADGELGSRVVRIPILVDGTPEPDKTVQLTLSEPGGCATLGTQTTAVLTIEDSDQPIVTDAFTVGGSVSGLEGTGLVLTEARSGVDVTPSNGAFVFDRGYGDGQEYEVRIASQPINPIQVCTVANASGTIPGASIDDVTVTCVTGPTNGALDPGFGSGGKVTSGLGGSVVAMALQADGKIVVVSSRQLARFLGDGSPDPAFAGGSPVTIEFAGSLFDEAFDVVLQPDGKILVSGVTHVGTSDDMAVARYLTSGAPDLGFGTQGQTSVDFAGLTDRAKRVLVQSDGKIILAGHAALPSPSGGTNDFAVARLTAAGLPDGSYGSGGKVTTNIAGATDLGSAAALDGSGRVVLVGRVAPGGGDNPDVGIVRYDTAGVPDEGFGEHGIVQRDLSSGSWDEATGVVIQPSGKIVVSVEAAIGPSFQYEVARFEDDGDLDDSFGTHGVTTTLFTTSNDYPLGLALAPDGKIVLAGQTSNLMAPDFGLARYSAEGAPDTSFDDDGKLTVDFFGASDGATCVLVQPDGRIVAGGFARNGTTTGPGIVRLNP